MSNAADSAEPLALLPEFMDSSRQRALQVREVRIALAKLEADVAYFQARLELIGELTSNHRIAQRKLFTLLHKAVARQILDTKRQHPDLH